MNEITIFGSQLINVEDFLILLFRFIVNLIFAYIIIIKIYSPLKKSNNYIFNFFVFNILIFFVSSVLSIVKLKTGFAFGLFAIFSILRYRTIQIPAKEMTFMFISIIIATINSTVTAKVSILEILFANLVIVATVYILERKMLHEYRNEKVIKYEKIELIVPDKREELITDLETRLGEKIIDIEIENIDFLRDIADVRVFTSND